VPGFSSQTSGVAHGALNWDTQVKADFTSLQTLLAQQSWSPGLGGTGAFIGSTGSSVNGFFSRQGTQVLYQGRLVFGSGATFGTATPYIGGFNLYGDLDVTNTSGYGRYIATNSNILNIVLHPISGQQLAIRVAGNNGQTNNATTIGNPTQGDQIIFAVQGILY
jgi:hypothetical protein